MTVMMRNVRRQLGVALLAMGSLASESCDKANAAAEGVTDEVVKQCGLSCPDPGAGVASGNASITGYAPIDSFFRSVVTYGNTAIGVSGDIDVELAGIQSVFQITDKQRSDAANLGAAITAKLKNDFKASVVVNAQPAKCGVDARVAAEVSAKCQAEAGCTIDPGKASFECKGTCTVDANVSGGCDADAEVRCNVTAPDFACQGECSGTCTVSTPQVDCSGTCRGKCNGTCTANANETSSDAACNGSCKGTCEAKCEVTGMAALDCKGSCNGSCSYTPPMGGCDARAHVTCDLDAEASASCTGSCDGEFTPPSAKCDASASCQASAKAEARFQVKCTPPSVEVKVVVAADGALGTDVLGMKQAQVDLLVDQLRARLPRLAAAQARAKLAAEAGSDLLGSGADAVNNTAKTIAKGDLSLFVAAKITQCTGDGLTEAKSVITKANATLKASTDNADSVIKVLGM